MGWVFDFGILRGENFFLIVLGLAWLVGAMLQDFKRREVDNVWNFSLIAFALAYRAAVSVGSGNYWFFINGVIGLLIFVVLGNLFYYARLFAGGDAKLLMALGAVLPLGFNWLVNLEVIGIFVFLFFACGSVYAIFYSFALAVQNWRRFRKEFLRFFKLHRRMVWTGVVFFVAWGFLAVFVDFVLVWVGVSVLLFPFLFVFAKAVEESCLVKAVLPREVTVGDWLYKDVVVNGKRLKAHWEGVSPKQLAIIRKSKKRILVRYGIQFTPSFFIAFAVLMILA